MPKVALRKESVDRNRGWTLNINGPMVALRKESVDRNILKTSGPSICQASLSARRAWIEILLVLVLGIPTSVALRKESVDRNHISRLLRCGTARSLSARRAWIEIILSR